MPRDVNTEINVKLRTDFAASLPNEPVDTTTLIIRDLNARTGEMTARMLALIDAADVS